MKKIIIIIIVLFLAIVLIGIFFAKKENSFIKIKNKKELPTSTSSTQTTQTQISETTPKESDLVYSLEIQKEINEEVRKLTKNLEPDKNKSITDYQKEIQEITKKIEADKNPSPETLIKVTQDLSLIKPPEILYEFHLELIKTFYTLGFALKELENTNDPIKKMMLYNLIKTTLEKIKL